MKNCQLFIALNMLEDGFLYVWHIESCVCVYVDVLCLIKISMHAMSQEHHLKLEIVLLTWKTAFDAKCRPKQVIYGEWVTVTAVMGHGFVFQVLSNDCITNEKYSVKSYMCKSNANSLLNEHEDDWNTAVHYNNITVTVLIKHDIGKHQPQLTLNLHLQQKIAKVFVCTGWYGYWKYYSDWNV